MNGPTPATPASDWEARLHKVELTVERIDTVVEVLKSRDASGAARLLDNDMAVVKVDIAAVKADIAALRPALATSNSHVAELRIDTTLRVESLSERIDHIEDQLAGLDARMRVMEVAQSHLSGHLDGRIDALEANLCGRAYAAALRVATATRTRNACLYDPSRYARRRWRRRTGARPCRCLKLDSRAPPRRPAS